MIKFKPKKIIQGVNEVIDKPGSSAAKFISEIAENSVDAPVSTITSNLSPIPGTVLVANKFITPREKQLYKKSGIYEGTKKFREKLKKNLVTPVKKAATKIGSGADLLSKKIISGEYPVPLLNV